MTGGAVSFKKEIPITVPINNTKQAATPIYLLTKNALDFLSVLSRLLE